MAATVRRSAGLCDAGVLDARAVAAHCIHIGAAERTALARRGVNVVHNPQSNCNNAVGIANLPGPVPPRSPRGTRLRWLLAAHVG